MKIVLPEEIRLRLADYCQTDIGTPEDKQNWRDLESFLAKYIEPISLFINSLSQWNVKTNLISNAELDFVLSRHIIDCGVISLFISRLRENRTFTYLYDIGSGGGFPGMEIAITNPSLNVHLCEQSQKNKGSTCGF